MLDLGCQVLLGTDNAMFVQPDLWGEMAFTSTVYHIAPGVILSSAVGCSAGLFSPAIIEEGSPARFLVLDPAASNLSFSRDPVASIVKRAGPSDIREKYLF